MPKWKVHLLFNSILIFIWVQLFLSLNLVNDYLLLIIMIFFSYFLSIFPDIDTSKSPIRRLFAVVFASMFTVYLFFNSPLNSLFLLPTCFILFYILFRFFPTKHRGITHNFWFSAIFSFIIVTIFGIIFYFSFINFIVYFIFILSGYLSHLFLDMI